MKVRIIATNEVVNVIHLSSIDNEIKYHREGMMDYGSISLDKVDLILDETPNTDTVDWEQRRYELARDVMSAIFSNCKLYDSIYRTDAPEITIPSLAMSFADEMIYKLKQK